MCQVSFCCQEKWFPTSSNRVTTQEETLTTHHQQLPQVAQEDCSDLQKKRASASMRQMTDSFSFEFYYKGQNVLIFFHDVQTMISFCFVRFSTFVVTNSINSLEHSLVEAV